jgi:hypothetical protein
MGARTLAFLLLMGREEIGGREMATCLSDDSDKSAVVCSIPETVDEGEKKGNYSKSHSWFFFCFLVKKTKE